MPQPTFLSSDTSCAGWTKCVDCGGVGCVAYIEGGKFANGLDINEYLRGRFSDE